MKQEMSLKRYSAALQLWNLFLFVVLFVVTSGHPAWENIVNTRTMLLLLQGF